MITPAEDCRACGRKLPPASLDLGALPLVNIYSAAEGGDLSAPRFPLAIACCTECTLVQLTHSVDPQVLFREYSYNSSLSTTFVAHAEAMVSALSTRFSLGRESRVVEVASNDGYLLQFFQARGIPALGIEPARNIAAAAVAKGIPTIDEFFGPEVVPEILRRFGPADVLIGNNVLAHVPAINRFLAAVHTCLAERGTAVFEFPYVRALVEKTAFDTIYHEHVCYFSLLAVDALATRAGLRLVDVSVESIHGGSLRVFLTKDPALEVSAIVLEMLASERAASLPTRLESFRHDVERLRQDLRELLHGLAERGARIAAYGAAAKGSILLNYCGIGHEIIRYAVDKNPSKQGRYIPGTRIPIRAPEMIAQDPPDTLLILPWNIADEVIAEQRDYAHRGGRFLIPVPHPRIVGGPA